MKLSNEIRRIANLLESVSITAAYNATSEEEANFKIFTKELAKLSKRYGVVVKSVGGVEIGEIDRIEYSDDITSGDLIPRVIWK